MLLMYFLTIFTGKKIFHFSGNFILSVTENNEYNKNKYREKLKAEGKISKKKELEQLREKIKTLRAKGLLNKKISAQLDIPIKKV